MTNHGKALSDAGASTRHVPLAALCIVSVILASFFLVLNPWFIEIHAKAQALVAEEIARENAAFCEKRGLLTGGREHASCVGDLNELRTSHDRRTNESVLGRI